MPKPQDDDLQRAQETQQNQMRELLRTKISEQVMHTLGHPANLRGVQIRPLWKDHFRVNVLVGADIASVKVAHSFFLVSDLEGTIITSTPVIRKMY